MKCQSPLVVMLLCLLTACVVIMAPCPSRAAEALPALSADQLDELLHDQGPLVISVMASWCPPCRKELPRLGEIYEQLQERGLKMVGISLDYSPKAMAKMVAASQVTFPFYWAGEEPMSTHGIRSIPLLIIVKDGTEVERIEGLHPAEELVKIFETYLGD